MRRLGIVPCVFLVIGSGCSFAMVRPAPQVVEGARPVCAPGAFPWLDLAGGAGMVGVTAVAAPLGDLGAALCDPGPGRRCPEKSSSSAYAFGYVTAAILAASAVYGFVAGASCEAAIARHAALPRQGGTGRLDVPPPPAIERPGAGGTSAGGGP